jgi:hypothetical protein
LVLLILDTTAVRAQDSDVPMFSLSGFGTLDEVRSNDNQADFTSSTFKPTGAGYSDAWSANVDSLIGMQVVANIAPKVSSLLQIISEQHYNGTYSPHVEWANVKYQVTSDFSIRVGRTSLPIFMETDSREIGYANPWVRPPLEVYSLSPLPTMTAWTVDFRS